MFIGFTTKQLLRKLEKEGDITPAQIRKFYQAVREFYTTAVEYALKNLPLKDKVLENAHFLNFQARETALISQVEFFVTRYNTKVYMQCIVCMKNNTILSDTLHSYHFLL